jgi:hypothetical protein
MLSEQFAMRFAPRKHLCLIAAYSIFGLTSGCHPLFASSAPRPTSLETLQIGLSEDKKVQLVNGWDSAYTSGDLSLVLSAINMLESAPPVLRTRIIAQAHNSTALPTLFKSLPAMWSASFYCAGLLPAYLLTRMASHNYLGYGHCPQAPASR